MDEVYVPLLSTLRPSGGSADVPGGAEGSSAGAGFNSNSEFLSNVQKFGSQISHAIQQLTGDVRLNVPQVYIYVHIYIYMYIHIHIHIHTYVYTYICIYIYTYMYIYMQVYLYTHTHRRRK